MINASRSVNIVTIEDPIEYLHKDKKGIITQREVGGDTLSFNAALRLR
jgi:twitching motility protein PilT